jgi:hypothetical protein
VSLACEYDRGEALAFCATPKEARSESASRDAILGLLEAVRTLDRECASDPRGCVCVVVAAGSWAVPDARLRSMAADTAKNLRSKRLCFVLVTRSAVVRGALKAITWLAPPPEGHRVEAADSVEAAYALAEEVRGGPLPRLRQLGQRAMARAERE